MLWILWKDRENELTFYIVLQKQCPFSPGGMWTNLRVPCDTESAYLVVELQAVVGLLREDFVCVHKLVVERLDLMAEDSTSDPTNFQFL